jgi:hypothetical protein
MYGDMHTYAVMSTDRGNTWKKFSSSEFTGFAHVIREDIVNEKLLFLGTEMGLFISLDGGNNWMRSKYQNMPWYNLVRDIKIQPQTNDLVIASHGRGIYIIDNIQPLREMVKSDLAQSVLFYPIQNFKYEYSPQYPQPASNLTGWAVGSRVIAPTFYYYLKERSNSGVKIEIYDAANKKIKDLNASSAKGLNKVYWDLSVNPPKVAQGGYIAQSSVLISSVIGPKVDIGKYKIVVKADGKEYVQNIQIEANPAKGLDAASIALLNKQSMRLFNLHERLFTLVDSLDKTVKVLAKGDTTVPVVKEKLHKLDSFKREIVELNRKSIFFDEFKYRRRVSDLYYSVASGLEPLSTSQEKGITLLEDQFVVFQKRFFELLK